MGEHQYWVSICIPTYNRAPYLRKCLDSLICQPEFLQKEVEIVISDNCSTDNTAEIVKGYAVKYSNIRYYRNEENIRDRNFPRCLLRGNGILRKLSNDTLLFKRGSLKFLCDAVQKYRKSRPILFFGNGNLKNMKGEKKKQTHTLNNFLFNVSFISTWIGAFSLWEEDCEDLISSEKACDTSLWQVWELFHLLQKDRSAVLYNESIVDVQLVHKKNVDYGIFKVFYHNFLGIVKPFVKNQVITRECFDYLEKELLFDFFMEYTLKWELQHNEYQFAGSENLKAAVWNQYRTRPYFRIFILKYYKKYLRKCLRAQFKQVIKKISTL